jgi:dipeptidyl aminopeptidase/acylaminoacyl peptidase
MKPIGRSILMLAAAAALLPLPNRAAELLTPSQALAYIRIGDLQFSPDGTKLAFVVTSYQWDALPRLRLMDIATGSTREVTPAGKSERSPQWSPDGERLAFLSNRGGKTQVYTLPAAGGEPTALTAQKFGVEVFHWSPDGTSVAYLAKDDGAPDEESGPQLADDEAALARLWVIDARSKGVRRVGKSGWRIDDFAWVSSSELLIAATDQPRLQAYTDAVYRMTTTRDAVEPVSRPPQPWNRLLVSPGGKEFAVRSTDAQGPLERDLFTAKVSDGRLHEIATPGGLAVAETRWRNADTLWVRVADGFFNRLWRLAPHAAPVRIEAPFSIAAFDVARDGRLALVGEDFAHLPEIYLREKDGTLRQLPRQQHGFEHIELASTTIFRTMSSDGLWIEAALMQPSVSAPGSKLPLVLLVHGGPSSNFSAGYGWETGWAQLLAAHGYQVLLVNPRGSNGYSEAFLEANRADWGGGDYRDLMTALDAVIARGGTDPERLGIGGWSYGAEMSAWAITQTRRFRAAVAGAGVFDQQAEFETESHPEADEWYFGTPWEHPDVFARNSPATYIGNARTPTLIFCGKEDSNNPVGQSIGLYRALKHLGVETEMVLYPGEGHSPRRGSYNIDMFTRILEWYDAHLKATPGAAANAAGRTG